MPGIARHLNPLPKNKVRNERGRLQLVQSGRPDEGDTKRGISCSIQITRRVFESLWGTVGEQQSTPTSWKRKRRCGRSASISRSMAEEIERRGNSKGDGSSHTKALARASRRPLVRSGILRGRLGVNGLDRRPKGDRARRSLPQRPASRHPLKERCQARSGRPGLLADGHRDAFTLSTIVVVGQPRHLPRGRQRDTSPEENSSDAVATRRCECSDDRGNRSAAMPHTRSRSAGCTDLQLQGKFVPRIRHTEAPGSIPRRPGALCHRTAFAGVSAEVFGLLHSERTSVTTYCSGGCVAHYSSLVAFSLSDRDRGAVHGVSPLRDRRRYPACISSLGDLRRAGLGEVVPRLRHVESMSRSAGARDRPASIRHSSECLRSSSAFCTPSVNAGTDVLVPSPGFEEEA